MLRDSARGLSATAVLASALVAGGCDLAAVDSRMATVGEVRYEPDAGGDRWQTPRQTAAAGAGDCEDLALYLNDLLRADRLDSRVVFGVADVTDARTGHAWVECVAHGELYVADPTRRLLARRKELPWWRYYALEARGLAGSPLLPRLRDYLARSEGHGVNEGYEAAATAANRRSAPRCPPGPTANPGYAR